MLENTDVDTCGDESGATSDTASGGGGGERRIQIPLTHDAPRGGMV